MIDLLSVSEILGYRKLQYTEYPLTEYRSAQIELRVLRLNTIDAALSEAAVNSVAGMVGDMKLEYTNHINILRSEGSRILNEIANLAGIPVGFDRFKGNTKPMFIRNNYG